MMWSRLRLLVLLGSLLPFSASSGQAHFENCLSGTGENAVIIITGDAVPEIDGEIIDLGDEIAVYSMQGVCVGTLTWNNANDALVVWGNDPFSTEDPGMLRREPMSFRIWDASEDFEYNSLNSAVYVSFSSAEPYYEREAVYQSDGIYLLEALRMHRFPDSSQSASIEK